MPKHTLNIVAVLFIFYVGLNKGLEISSSENYNAFDGSYYADIAENVSNGTGFKTDISSFDQNLKSLPRVSAVYPLWPMLGGELSRLFPDSIEFDKKLRYINVFIACMAMWFLFLIYKRLTEYQALALIGLYSFSSSIIWKRYIASTYTEPLTFLMVFLSIFLIVEYIQNKRWSCYPAWMGGFIGLILGFSFLARSQSILFIVITAVFLVIFWKQEKISFRFLISLTLALVTVGASFVIWRVSDSTEHMTFKSLFIFQENYDYSLFQPLSHGSEEPLFIKLREGLLTFFSFGDHGGASNSGLFIFTFVPCLLFLKKFSLFQKWIICIGLIYLVSLLPSKMSIASPWLFGHRHGILIVLLTVGATIFSVDCFLKSKPKYHTVLFVLFFCFTIYSGICTRISEYSDRIRGPKMEKSIVTKDLTLFLQNKARVKGEKLHLLSSTIRSVSYFSQQYGYMFEARRENWKEYLMYKMEYLNIDYFIVGYYDHTMFNQEKYYHGLKTNQIDFLEPVISFGEGANLTTVYQLKNN